MKVITIAIFLFNFTFMCIIYLLEMSKTYSPNRDLSIQYYHASDKQLNETNNETETQLDINIETEFQLEANIDEVEIEIDIDIDNGHPYRDLNLNRNLTPFNVFTQGAGNPYLYQIQKSLGNGTFGTVFRAVHIVTGDKVAMKMLFNERQSDVLREISILRDMKDAPNFLKMRDIFKEKDKTGKSIFGIVLDFFKGTKFEEIYAKLDAHQVKVMIFQVMRTLEHAHSRGIMHKDIKPLNVLMDPESLEVRVIDWGQAEYYVPGKNFTKYASTLYYKPPELLLTYEKYDYSLDIWSTGCMLAEMAFKKHHFFSPDRTMFPYSPENKKLERMVSMRGQLDAYARVLGTKALKEYVEKFQDDMILDIMEFVGDYEGKPLSSFINDANLDVVDSDLIDLLEKMLVIDHTKRITMKEALAHPYFDELRGQYY